MIRFAVCGCGGISHLHAECLAILAKEGLARLVAGVEIHAGRAEAWSKKWSVPVFESLDELFKNVDVDVVTLATPSGLHGRQGAQVAASGKHILSEKPLDIRLEEADAAISAAQRAGVTLSCIFQQRFGSGPEKAKRAIDQGYFGRIVSVHCETPWYREQSYYDQDPWRGSWALDGGVLGNQSPHMIDRMMWLGGDIEEVLHVELRCGQDRAIEAETVAAAIVRLASGAIGTITGTTLAYPGMPQRVVVCGTDGSCAFEGDELTFFHTRRPFEDCESESNAALSMRSKAAGNALALALQAHLQNIRDVAEAIRDGRPPRVQAADARRFTSALSRIYEAANVDGWAGKSRHVQPV